MAAALEQAAVRTQARAGLAAAAAFLQRSVALTADPARRAERALAAALANLHAGAFDTALGLLAQAEADAIDDLQRARVEQLRGQVEWASVAGRERTGSAAAGRQETRSTRCRARPGDLPLRMGGLQPSPVRWPDPAAFCWRFPGRPARPRRQRRPRGLVTSSSTV